jgi:hypothetical protein
MLWNSKKKYMLLIVVMLLTTAVYWPGLSGTFVFDDFPNIVDNPGIQAKNAGLASLMRAALSSPSSELSRPLASLSFAANYLLTGLSPYWMKLTNLVIHLMNGLLVFFLAQALLQASEDGSTERHSAKFAFVNVTINDGATSQMRQISVVALLIACSWMILPINLTGVLYVVQRMESMANLFVMTGLVGYVAGRRQMLSIKSLPLSTPSENPSHAFVRIWSSVDRGLVLCVIGLIVPVVFGVMAKETAVMLPMYALMVELTLFRFHPACTTPLTHASVMEGSPANQSWKSQKSDRRIIALFLLILLMPILAGLAWMLPRVLSPQSWITRDFTLGTRLLSEARIMIDYIVWTLLPTPHGLSFYHDDFRASSGLLTPLTTLASITALAGLVALAVWLRPRRPLAALGIALFLSCHLLTGTILPLELIYEHRNYFASFGLLLAIVPLLAAPSSSTTANRGNILATDAIRANQGLPFPLARYSLLAGLLLCWTTLTALTAYAWGSPLRLAEDLALRAPQSPRAQYELGRLYIMSTQYDPNSKFRPLVYPPLERAASLPNSSILPEQALIFMNARMHLPLKDAWWNSLIAKLKARAPTVQDESSLISLTQCVRDKACDLPQNRMMEAFMASLTHPDPSARLLACYGDYAWNVLDDKPLGLRMARLATHADPREPVYQVTLIKMLLAEGQLKEAHELFQQLQSLNYGGRLNGSLSDLEELPGMQ